MSRLPFEVVLLQKFGLLGKVVAGVEKSDHKYLLHGLILLRDDRVLRHRAALAASCQQRCTGTGKSGRRAT